MPKFGNNVDLAKFELQNARLQNLASAPSSPVVGQFYFDTVLAHEYVYNGSAWEQASGATGSVTAVTIATANGFSGTVANQGTTPALTIIAGAITPTSVGATGTVTGSNLSGTNTGDQTITLTGNVTGSGTGSFATTIAAGAVTNGMLAGSIAASKLVGTDITIVGTIVTGTWQASVIAAAYLPALNGITAPTGDVSLNSHRITNLLDPASAQDAATKIYVDLAIQGTPSKATAYYATTAALPACTYANGTAGVGATLTGNVNAALTAIDGVTPTAGDVVLVKNQATAAQNGLFTVTQVGDASHPFILTRQTGMDSSAEFSGAVVAVESGTTNGGSLWICAINAPTVGTTAITFTEINKAADLQQGSGITISGNTVSVTTNGITGSLFRQSAALSVVGNGTNATANVADIAGTADQVLVVNHAGNALAFGQVSLTAGVTGALPIGNGGTGQTGATAARQALGGAGVYNAAGTGTGATFTISQATHGLGTSGNSYTDIDGVVWDVSSNPAVKVYPDVSVNTSTGLVTFTWGSSQTLSNFRFTVIGK